ncbi:MAG: hypothetical protein H7039_02135 [Bryobacteraceae bacterium]|nr:hypothetical protein [Bryobacteraceae bacterium]
MSIDLLRPSLLQLVETPDRAWVTILAGALLMTREFCAPGSVVPGVLGGVAMIAGVYGLSQWPVTPAGAFLCIASVSACLWLFTTRSKHPFTGGTISGIGTFFGALLLVRGDAGIALEVALLTIPVMTFVGWLLWFGLKARQNKFPLE